MPDLRPQRRIWFVAQGQTLQGTSLYRSLLRDAWMVEIPEVGDVEVATDRLSWEGIDA